MAEDFGIRISLLDGEIEIWGSEEFVSNQIDELVEPIYQKLIDSPVKEIGEGRAKGQNQYKPKSNDLANDFSSLFHVFDDGTVQILKKLPGSSKKERLLNLIRLYLLAKSQVGDPVVPFKELRPECERHNVYDSSNFASYLKSEGDILVKGSSKAYTAELSVPGQEAAKTLAKELISEE
jgi:hypothetical protein